MTAMTRLDARVAHSGQLLSALSYRGVLARGFALVRDETGHAVHAAAAIGPNAPLAIFADGRVRGDGGCRPANGGGKAYEPASAGPARNQNDDTQARDQAGRSGQFV